MKLMTAELVLLAGLLAPSAWANDVLNAELYDAATRDTAKVEALIAKGADVNGKNQLAETPLHQAAQFGSKEMVDLLIAHGADVNARDHNGATPLHHAAEYGNKVALEELVAHGADVTLKTDGSGATPLHQAVHSNQKVAVETLLALGADANAGNKWGKTPLDLTVQFKDESVDQAKIVTLLQTAMARKIEKRAGNSHAGLQTLLAEFKGHSDNEALRKSILSVSRTLTPAPALPAEALEADGRAQYVFKSAKSDADYLEVAKQYLQAIEAAPWVPKYYYNLCMVLDKTVYTQQALHACRLYLMADPNAPEDDAARVHALTAGQQYALGKTVAQLKKRTAYRDRIGMDDMYRMGGLEGTVGGKDITLKIAVDWHASPPQYQLLAACLENGDVFTQTYDLVSTDKSIELCSTGSTPQHLLIKPAGEGFVELSDSGGNGSLRATLDQLFDLKTRALEQSPLFYVYDVSGSTHRTFVSLAQGGSNAQYAGFAFYESDCNGAPLRKDPRALPGDFLSYEEKKKSGFGKYAATYGEALENLASCQDALAAATGYANWGKDEK